MPRSILVPFDLSAEASRAVRVAAGLGARAGLPLELLHVADLGDDPDTVHTELRARLAELPEVDADCYTLRVVLDEDPVTTLAEAFAEHPDSLVVVGTSARGPLSELLLGSVSEALLARADQPMLLVGPHVDPSVPVGPTLVAAVRARELGERLVPSVVEWSRAVGVQPWFVQVGSPLTDADPRNDRAEFGLAHRLAEKARAESVDAQWDVLHGRHAVPSLIDFTSSMGGGMIAVASERWADPDRIHWASTARSLVHRSPFPVLVLPVHHAAVPA